MIDSMRFSRLHEDGAWIPYYRNKLKEAEGVLFRRGCPCVFDSGVHELSSKETLKFWSCQITPVSQGDTVRWSGTTWNTARSGDGFLVCAFSSQVLCGDLTGIASWESITQMKPPQAEHMEFFWKASCGEDV